MPSDRRLSTLVAQGADVDATLGTLGIGARRVPRPGRGSVPRKRLSSGQHTRQYEGVAGRRPPDHHGGELIAVAPLLSDDIDMRHGPRTGRWNFAAVVVIDVFPCRSPRLWIRRHDRDTHQSL
jgi:hypothetical protein